MAWWASAGVTRDAAIALNLRAIDRSTGRVSVAQASWADQRVAHPPANDGATIAPSGEARR
jgi:hypothetical protein